MHPSTRTLFLLLAAAFAHDAVAQQRWVEPAPAFRAQHAAAYDAARDRTVLFGGRDHTGLRDSTWLWDGADWNASTAGGPSARAGHAMVWDDARQVVVLFGGNDDTTSLDDTWTWDGSAWTLQTTAIAPAPRAAHVMSWDPARNVVVLFGGYTQSSGNARNDTWEWDGSSWTQVASTGPLARWSPAMTWDGAQTVLFGGSTGNSTRLGDTWTWDGTAWTQQAPTASPVPRLYHSMVSTGAEAILFGGLDGGFGQLRDTWTWSGGSWSQASPILSPPSRDRTAMVFDTARGAALLVGGIHSDLEADTWTYDGVTWQRLGSSPPSARSGAAATTHNLTPILFGGVDAGGRHLDDTWIWNGQTWSMLNPQVRPQARAGHAMAFEPLATRTLLFGGRNAAGLVGETWEWTGSGWNRRFPAVSPPDRSGAAMGWYGGAFAVVMFGGFGASGPLDDTWLWNSSQGWRAIPTSTRPSARDGASAASDLRSGQWVLFGGATAAGLSDQTWTFDGLNWTLTTPALSPPARRDATLVFEPQLATLLLYGGQDASGAALDDLWEYDGTTWLQRAASGDSDRFGHAAAWDGRSNQLLVNGGTNSDGRLRGDTRLLGHGLVATHSAFGQGCPGSAGTPTLVTSPLNRPWLGTTVDYEIVNIPTAAPVAFVVFGFDRTTWNGNPLPLDLAPFGLAGCQAWVAPFSTELASAAAGRATWSLALPSTASLQGAEYFLQALVPDPGVNRVGATMSNGVASTAALR